jgi:hypothetical protein
MTIDHSLSVAGIGGLRPIARFETLRSSHFGDGALYRLAEVVRAGKPLTGALSPNPNGVRSPQFSMGSAISGFTNCTMMEWCR